MFGFPAPIRKSSFVPLGHFVSDFSAHKSALSVRGAVCPCDKQLLNKLWLFLTIARKLKTQGVCLVLRHPIVLKISKSSGSSPDSGVSPLANRSVRVLEESPSLDTKTGMLSAFREM